MKTIIHIGLPKTATTFLQSEIFPRLTNVTLISRPYTQQSKIFNKLQYADDCYYNLDEIKKEVESFSGSKILISDEKLCGLSFLGSLIINRSLVAKRLQKLFPEAEIILCLRGQQSILMSGYSQVVKMGYPQTIDKYIWHSQKEYTYDDYKEDLSQNRFRNNLNARYYNHLSNNIHLIDLCYYELITLYQTNFSKVHVFTYEQFCQNPQEFLMKLENIFQEKINLNDTSGTKIVNSKFDPYKLRRTIAINKFKSLIKSKNKYLLQLGGLLYRLISKDLQKPIGYEQDYIEMITKNFYVDNNRKIVEEFPSIGIQNYPDQYQLEYK